MATGRARTCTLAPEILVNLPPLTNLLPGITNFTCYTARARMRVSGDSVAVQATTLRSYLCIDQTLFDVQNLLQIASLA